MYAVLLFAIMACASAAPNYHRHHGHGYPHDYDRSLEKYIEQEIFDTRRFWDELRQEMLGLDAMLADFSRRFPSSVSNENIEGNKYKIKIALSSYEEKEIAVKARKGLLIVQAVHKVNDVIVRNYLDVRTLPNYVDVNGNWTFENGILTIVFPLVRNGGTEATVTEGPVTEAPEHSRENVDDNPTDDANQNADVGADRGDLGARTELLTNEIQGQRDNVEATTYAVDLKSDVELLPVHY